MVYSPPLRDPYNPNLDPMLILGLQSLGAAMHTRLAAENKPGAAAAGVRRVAWYDSKTPLRSGWAWGQEVLDQRAAAVSAKVGKGNVLLFGPEILQRSQPHGTFKFLFNGIVYGLTNHGTAP